MCRITVLIPVELRDALDAYALEHDLTLSQLVRRLLKEGSSQ